MTLDLINGFFEGGLALMLTLNIRRLLKDRKVEGVSLLPAVFVAVWGYWNLFYYPNLHQWFSFIGGLGVVVGNTTWLALALWFRAHPPVKTAHWFNMRDVETREYNSTDVPSIFQVKPLK